MAQPDMGVIAKELNKFNNIPAIAQGNGILHALADIRGDLARRFDEVNVRIDAINARLTEIHTQCTPTLSARYNFLISSNSNN
jgi:hypothetical protein